MNRDYDFSLIIPCFNEGSTFEKSVLEVYRVLGGINRRWEVIFVDDKSTDETSKKVKDFVTKLENARALFHNKNMGRGKTVSDGIKMASGEICGFLDVDLEVSASYIPVFIKEIERGFDMAVGKRFYEASYQSIMRYLSSKIYTYCVKMIINIPIEDTETGYKFFRRRSILPIIKRAKDNHWFWDTEICARSYWAGLTISQIPVLFIRRSDKKSTVKLLPDTFDYIIKLIAFRMSNNTRTIRKQ